MSGQLLHRLTTLSVERRAAESFDVSPEVAAKAVRLALRHRRYRDTEEVEPGKQFVTNVKPSWWLLGTEMTVRVEPLGSGAKVVAETWSQAAIRGDVFGFYDRYLRDLIVEVEAALSDDSAAGSV